MEYLPVNPVCLTRFVRHAKPRYTFSLNCCSMNNLIEAAGTTTSYLESRLLSNIYLHLCYVVGKYLLLLGKLFVIAFSSTYTHLTMASLQHHAVAFVVLSLEWHFLNKILTGNSIKKKIREITCG